MFGHRKMHTIDGPAYMASRPDIVHAVVLKGNFSTCAALSYQMYYYYHCVYQFIYAHGELLNRGVEIKCLCTIRTKWIVHNFSYVLFLCPLSFSLFLFRSESYAYICIMCINILHTWHISLLLRKMDALIDVMTAGGLITFAHTRFEWHTHTHYMYMCIYLFTRNLRTYLYTFIFEKCILRCRIGYLTHGTVPEKVLTHTENCYYY